MQLYNVDKEDMSDSPGTGHEEEVHVNGLVHVIEKLFLSFSSTLGSTACFLMASLVVSPTWLRLLSTNFFMRDSVMIPHSSVVLASHDSWRLWKCL